MENRTRISVHILNGIRHQLGTDYPLLYRLGADDMKPGGIRPEDGVSIAQILAKSGVDIIDVSGGLGGSAPQNTSEQGFFINLASKIKKAVNVPVIGVGGITSLDYADKVIREGLVDLVAIGRAILREKIDLSPLC